MPFPQNEVSLVGHGLFRRRMFTNTCALHDILIFKARPGFHRRECLCSTIHQSVGKR